MSRTIPVISGKEMELSDFKLWRLGKETKSSSLHRHDGLEVILVTNGMGNIQIDFKTYTYAPHTLLLISPGQIHQWIDNDSSMSLEGFLLIFAHNMLADHTSDYSKARATSYFPMIGIPPLLAIDRERSEYFQQLFALLEREQGLKRDKDHKTVLRHCLQLMLIELGRIHQGWQLAHKEEARFQLTKQFLALVETHFQSINRMSDYASMLHVTKNHLIESVKQTLGKPAGEVFYERRLLEAKRLLRFTQAPIEDIAHRLGYEDASYFGRFFKKNVGTTPSAFRKQI